VEERDELGEEPDRALAFVRGHEERLAGTCRGVEAGADRQERADGVDRMERHRDPTRQGRGERAHLVPGSGRGTPRLLEEVVSRHGYLAGGVGRERPLAGPVGVAVVAQADRVLSELGERGRWEQLLDRHEAAGRRGRADEGMVDHE
jgi:hypothetical protein